MSASPLPDLILPKRWSREKRKLARARIREMQWRAFYWAQLTTSLKTTLDAVWGEAMNPISWEDCGFKPATGAFIDDNTFLVDE